MANAGVFFLFASAMWPARIKETHPLLREHFSILVAGCGLLVLVFYVLSGRKNGEIRKLKEQVRELKISSLQKEQ